MVTKNPKVGSGDASNVSAAGMALFESRISIVGVAGTVGCSIAREKLVNVGDWVRCATERVNRRTVC